MSKDNVNVVDVNRLKHLETNNKQAKHQILSRREWSFVYFLAIVILNNITFVT